MPEGKLFRMTGPTAYENKQDRGLGSKRSAVIAHRLLGGLVAQRLGRWTCYQKIVSSTRGRVANKWLLLEPVTVYHLGI